MRAGRRTSLLALAALALAFAEPVAAQGGDELPLALLDAARQSASVGDWASAYDYAAEASRQDSGNADILYLYALAGLSTGKPLGDALANVNAALATGRFSYYSRRDASTLLAELLARERRWQEALDALGPPGQGRATDSAYRLIRARAFAGLGDRGAFAAELGEALRRFPDDPAFARLFLARAGSFPSPASARELGDIILSRLSRYAVVDPELPVLAAPLMADISARRDAILAYRSAGRASPASTLRALEYGLIDEAAAAAELLAPSKPVAMKDLSSLFALAGSPAGRAAVSSALASWSGTVETDVDGDGIAELSFSLAGGLATGWRLDSDQDGVVDERASFADGLPTSVVLLRGGMEIDIEYSAYPAAASVSFAENGERRSYAFAPEALAFSPIAMRTFSGAGRSAIFFPYASPVPAPSERACAALALSVAVEAGSSRRIVHLDKGTPVSATSWEGGRLFSTTSYERGLPVLERVDADGDGRFETERGFAAGGDGAATIAWLRSDIDGDGVFEYREQTVFPFRKEWDYDGDGSVDAVQYRLADGSTREEFSSRLDGRLDEALVVKDGKIVSLSRDGASLALLPDSNPRLTWIGRKSFDLGSNLPAGDGIFFHMGKRYKLTRVGDLAFAELIP